MTTVVIGDIGGTNSRLRLISLLPHSFSFLKSTDYYSNAHANFNIILQDFLGNTTPQLAVFAIAGPIVGDTAHFVNQKWSPNKLSASDLESSFNVNKVLFINDFEAAEYGCLVLNEEDYVCLNPSVLPQPCSSKVVIGPGTGLGEALLVWSGSKYIAVPGEGGHSDFAAHTDEQWKFVKYMQELLQTTEEYSQFRPCETVSYELCLAGRGSYHLYDFFRLEYPELASPEFDQLWKDSPEDRMRIMMEYGFNKKDLICQKSVECWVKFLAYEVGNLIAKNLPFGGVYLIGGLVCKNFEGILNEREIFFEALRSKPRHICDVIEKVPIFLVRNESVGINGVIEYAKNWLKGTGEVEVTGT